MTMITDRKIVDSIIKDYLSGKSFYSLGKIYNTYPTTIRRILISSNVELRNDTVTKKEMMSQEGCDELIEWLRSQPTLMTRGQIAERLGKKRLDDIYLTTYPEIAKYIKPRKNNKYTSILYEWLNANGISYKPSDKKTLGVVIDAILLGKYEGQAIQIMIKSYNTSMDVYKSEMNRKYKRSREKGIQLITIRSENDLYNLDYLLDTLEENSKVMVD